MKQRAIKILALVLLMGSVAFADSLTLLNEDWSTTSVGSYSQGQTFGSWKVSSGTVDVLGAGYYGALCASGGISGKCLDLAGVSAGNILATDSLSLNPGSSYTLSFELAGSQRGNTNTVYVTLGSAFSTAVTLASGDKAQTYSYTFTVDNPTIAYLTFQDAPNSSAGALLGKVSLVDPPIGNVPEPTSLAMLSGGLVMMGGFFRRKKQVL